MDKKNRGSPSQRFAHSQQLADSANTTISFRSEIVAESTEHGWLGHGICEIDNRLRQRTFAHVVHPVDANVPHYVKVWKDFSQEYWALLDSKVVKVDKGGQHETKEDSRMQIRKLLRLLIAAYV